MREGEFELISRLCQREEIVYEYSRTDRAESEMVANETVCALKSA